MILMVDEAAAELQRIMSEKSLVPVFQPILDFRARAFLGFEALIRGPQDSTLEMPNELFSLARVHGLGLELEHLCREVTLQTFARLKLPGRLFLNVSPGALLDARMMNGATHNLLNELGIAPNRLVIELTENEKITDLPGIYAALSEYRGRGFQIAIDDLGEGFANLRMWSDLRPEFVKIDKHFVHGIADDRIKYHFVRAMQDLAEICHASLIAEGIERQEDFSCLRDMGIACGQGYFMAKPMPDPLRHPNSSTLAALGKASLSLLPGASGGTLPTAQSLLKEIQPISIDANNEAVIARFAADRDIDVLPVVNGVQPVGMINRHTLFDRFARPFQKELFGKKSCERFMDPAPLIVDQHATIHELAMMLSMAPKHYLLDGFIVTAEGCYKGVGSSHDLMALITEMQINAARYANPLTQLPGNVPINEHLDRMLRGAHSFVAAYIDIDNFKPFNDTYGYRRGDDVIQLLGQLVCAQVDQRQDFVGHIGGDDFFVIFQSADWEMRCWEIVQRFAAAVSGMVNLEDHSVGGYMAENRKGEVVFQPLPTLSIGAVRIAPGDFDSHREVAASASDAKKQAKKKKQNMAGGAVGSVFVERRQGLVGDGKSVPGRTLN
jgi:diguanylate cyclase (GGDEF)-like protein